jgi:hypothetical protein
MTGIILSLAVGVGVSDVWWAVAAVEVVLGVATVVLLLRRPAEERPAALGLIAVAAGVFAVALTIGAARAEWPSEQVQGWSRYSHLIWPLLGAAYFAWRWSYFGLPLPLPLPRCLRCISAEHLGTHNAFSRSRLRVKPGTGADSAGILRLETTSGL